MGNGENNNCVYDRTAGMDSGTYGGRMSRYRESCEYDAWQDKIAEYRDQQREAMRSACENCDSHKTLGCLYYDPEEETFDYEECFRDSGGWE